jgi:hypothetical protein
MYSVRDVRPSINWLIHICTYSTYNNCMYFVKDQLDVLKFLMKDAWNWEFVSPYLRIFLQDKLKIKIVHVYCLM